MSIETFESTEVPYCVQQECISSTTGLLLVVGGLVLAIAFVVIGVSLQLHKESNKRYARLARESR